MTLFTGMINLTTHFEIIKGEKEKISNFTLSFTLSESKKISDLKEQFKTEVFQLKPLDIIKFEVSDRKNELNDDFVIEKSSNLVSKVFIS